MLLHHAVRLVIAGCTNSDTPIRNYYSRVGDAELTLGSRGGAAPVSETVGRLPVRLSLARLLTPRSQPPEA